MLISSIDSEEKLIENSRVDEGSPTPFDGLLLTSDPD